MDLFIDAEKLSELVDISIREARKIIRTVQEELEAEGYYVPHTKKLTAPAERVLKKIGVKNETGTISAERSAL